MAYHKARKTDYQKAATKVARALLTLSNFPVIEHQDIIRLAAQNMIEAGYQQTGENLLLLLPCGCGLRRL